MTSSHLILCRPLLLLPSIFPNIRVFSNESALHMGWPKYWSFSFSISPSNEHPGLIFRMDWLGLLAVQGALKSLLQHHSSKASIHELISLLLVETVNRSHKRSRASLVAQVVKRLPAVRETWVRSLSWEEPLEKEMATHSSTLAWRSEEPSCRERV